MSRFPDRLRQSLRGLARNKRFSALAILSLALAIALNTTMYSVLDALINPRLDMREPDRLYTLGYIGDYGSRVPATEKRDAVLALKSFEGAAGRTSNIGSDANVAERGARQHDVHVLNVTPNFFALVGNRPLAGRLLSDVDVNSEPRPVVISVKLWKQLFPERASFDTASIILGDEPRVVVGLLPYEADFPGTYADVWQLTPNTPTGIRRSFNLVRLKPGVTREQATVELKVLAQQLAFQANESPKDTEFRLDPAVGEPFRLQRFHLALIAAVTAVLLVACVNLANLQLARGIARSRELATRSALGATRRDIIGQLVLESMWLALAGLLLGLILTAWWMKLVSASIPPSLSDFLVRPQTSWRLFGFAAGASFVCLGFIGLFPAIQLSRVDIHEIIKSGAGTGRSRRSRRQYGALVVVQISLALALLVGATLLLRTAAGLYQMNVPEHFDRLLFGYVQVINPRSPPGLRSERLPDVRRAWPLAEGVLGRVRALPNVENAAIAVWRQPTGLTISLADPGGKPREIQTGLQFSYRLVSPEFARVTGLVIHKGRDFAPGEFAEPLVIVDDQTARYLWPGQEPVGQRIKLGRDSSRAAWHEVIGVVRHFDFWTPFSRANQEERMARRMGAVLVLAGSDTAVVGRGTSAQLVVRARREEHVPKLPNQLRTAIRIPAEGIGVSYLESWRRIARVDLLRERQNFVAALFTMFATLALALAMLGVYAIVSQTVSQRTREFGVRIALGAGARDIRRAVLQQGNVLALSGIAFGLILAARTVGLLQGFLRSEDDRFDSPLFGVVSLVLFGVALIASYIPARRAMRIDPVVALRNE